MSSLTAMAVTGGTVTLFAPAADGGPKTLAEEVYLQIAEGARQYFGGKSPN